MQDSLLGLIEEQMAVHFDGKINALQAGNRQLLGSIYIREGNMIRVDYKNQGGLKALFNIYVDSLNDDEISLVVEPEIVDHIDKNIHHPFKVVTNKLSQFMTEYEAHRKLKPPANVKLMIQPGFVEKGERISENEFTVLTTISDYNKIEEIYKNCSLLEFEVTKALISLRQKGALKVIQVK